MASCVISAIVDTDDPSMPVIPACVVHTAWAPCLHDGEPACPLPLHSLPGTTRSQALRLWKTRTRRQRPLVIHRQDGRAAEEHDTENEGGCSCGPEVLPAEEATR